MWWFPAQTWENDQQILQKHPTLRPATYSSESQRNRSGVRRIGQGNDLQKVEDMSSMSPLLFWIISLNNMCAWQLAWSVDEVVVVVVVVALSCQVKFNKDQQKSQKVNVGQCTSTTAPGTQWEFWHSIPKWFEIHRRPGSIRWTHPKTAETDLAKSLNEI